MMPVKSVGLCLEVITMFYFGKFCTLFSLLSHVCF